MGRCKDILAGRENERGAEGKPWNSGALKWECIDLFPQGRVWPEFPQKGFTHIVVGNRNGVMVGRKANQIQ
jgi:hypothetical protein